MLVCRWCGEEYEDNASVDRAEEGFWCDACDGFTHFDKIAGERHRMLLLLEQGGASVEEKGVKSGEVVPDKKLSKRLSPLRYPGGKSRLIDMLQARLMADHIDTLVEVFAGGASLGLSLLDAGCIETLVLNDYDPFVYRFWKVCLENPGSLCRRVEERLPTVEDFWAAKEVVRRVSGGDVLSDEDVAWAFFLLNRTCFSGIIAANPMGGKQGGDGFLSRWNPETLVKRIQRVAELSPNIKLYNKDCEAFLEEDAYWLNRCTLFVDPPYVEKGKALYTSSFQKEDHERLADMLNSLYTGMNGPDIIMTYDDHPLVRELYPWAEVQTVRRAYSC